jgi:RNA-directed DNA polymerase
LRNRLKVGKQMTAISCAGAPIPEATWYSVNWRKALGNVRRLQVRIVKAVQQGRWNKVKALQRLLRCSFSARVLAVKRVTENQGRKTAGVDQVLWDTPVRKMQATETMNQRGYRAQPLRRVYIPKKNGKVRPLGIPTMFDRAKQAQHLLALEPLAEATGDPNSYGFRRERSCADAIEQCFRVLARKDAAVWVLEGDIRSCFDQIGHDWLLTHIVTDKRTLQQWLTAGYMEAHAFYPTEARTPQGGIISPVLANLALDGLEDLLKQRYPRRQGLKVHLIRYADDFVITCGERTVLIEEIRPLVKAFLAERGLQLSPEKTVITHIDDGFDFLGQTIRKFNGKLIIKPSHQSQQTLLEKVRRIIDTEGQQLSAAGLIRRLNPLLRGWANYHRHVVAKRTFQRIDNEVFQAIWSWVRRRHPEKRNDWCYHHYFVDRTGRACPFQAEVIESDGQRHTLELVNAARTAIRRHVKIQSAANPYDPAWETYFEQRRLHKTVDELPDRYQLRALWRLQRGLCPVCGDSINLTSGWHIHHLVWRVYGGGDELENLVLLHPACHLQLP